MRTGFVVKTSKKSHDNYATVSQSSSQTKLRIWYPTDYYRINQVINWRQKQQNLLPSVFRNQFRLDRSRNCFVARIRLLLGVPYRCCLLRIVPEVRNSLSTRLKRCLPTIQYGTYQNLGLRLQTQREGEGEKKRWKTVVNGGPPLSSPEISASFSLVQFQCHV